MDWEYGISAEEWARFRVMRATFVKQYGGDLASLNLQIDEDDAAVWELDLRKDSCRRIFFGTTFRQILRSAEDYVYGGCK